MNQNAETNGARALQELGRRRREYLNQDNNAAAVRVFEYIEHYEQRTPCKALTRFYMPKALGMPRATLEQAIRSLLEQNLITEKQPECFRLVQTTEAAQRIKEMRTQFRDTRERMWREVTKHNAPAAHG